MSPLFRRLVLTGFLQGLLTWGLFVQWRVLKNLPLIEGAVAWLLLAVPASIYLSENAGLSTRRRTVLVAGIALVYGLLGAYAGWMALPLREIVVAVGEHEAVTSAFPGSFGHMLAAAVMGFMTIALVCGWQSSARRFDYPSLFVVAWRNALLSLSALALTGIFWMVLMAGAMLMKSIGLEFVARILETSWFSVIATCTLIGVAFAVGHARADLLVSLRRFWLGMNAWLLVLLLFFGVMWAVALPFTGLSLLFNTRNAAFTLLWFAALAVTFLNCAWQDGLEAPVYGPRLRRVLAWAWLSLLAVCGVAGFALWLRIAQYGLSEDRVWAALVWLLASGYALGYALSVMPRVWKSDATWMPSVGKTNIVMAIVAVLSLLLLSSPLMDPRRLAVNAQLERIAADKVPVKDIDMDYLRWQTGRWGLLALHALTQQKGSENERLIAEAARQALAKTSRYDEAPSKEILTTQEMNARIRVVSAPHEKPKALPENLAKFLQTDLPTFSYQDCNAADKPCGLWLHDFNNDGIDEALVITEIAETYSEIHLLTPDVKMPNGWRLVMRENLSTSFSKIANSIETGNAGTVKPAWPDLQLGGKRVPVVDLLVRGG